MKNGRELIRESILKKVMELFDRMAENPEYRDVIGKEFLPSCISVANDNMAKPDILKPAIV